MTDEVGINLPAMRLVCHLVALSNITNPVPAVTQSPPEHQAEDQLPDGYVAYPDIKIAYKFYNANVANWAEARNLCLQDGAQLAVIDSVKKVEYLKSQIPVDTWVHSGIIRVDNIWINVNTGLPPLSLPWHPGYPLTETSYAWFNSVLKGLTNYEINELQKNYLCELPIFPNSTIPAN